MPAQGVFKAADFHNISGTAAHSRPLYDRSTELRRATPHLAVVVAVVNGWETKCILLCALHNRGTSVSLCNGCGYISNWRVK